MAYGVYVPIRKRFPVPKAKDSTVKLLVQVNIFLLAHKHHMPQSGRRNLKIFGIYTFHSFTECDTTL